IRKTPPPAIKLPNHKTRKFRCHSGKPFAAMVMLLPEECHKLQFSIPALTGEQPPMMPSLSPLSLRSCLHHKFWQASEPATGFESNASI
ncbi:hypothetical protein, partial [Schleiferilactobacillus shenzhenensis]|uniref:hypothetical protein n=1 Tax=Schleiferilactobacillus shenzhenensis TaxID=1231337 RepID=UPI001C660030